MSILPELDTKKILKDIKNEHYDFLPQLVSLVRQNPILYEKSNKYYYNRHKKEKVWRDIAAQTNKTASECKSKWTGLREKFVREQKKRLKHSSTGGVPEHEWELFSEMLFLREVTTPRKLHSMDMVGAIKYPPSSPAVDEQPFPAIQESLTPLPLRKRSFDGLCDQFGHIITKLEDRLDAQPKRIIGNSDADELFIRTVVSMIEELPASVKDEIKSDIFNKIIEARKRFRDNS